MRLFLGGASGDGLLEHALRLGAVLELLVRENGVFEWIHVLLGLQPMGWVVGCVLWSSSSVVWTWSSSMRYQYSWWDLGTLDCFWMLTLLWWAIFKGDTFTNQQNKRILAMESIRDSGLGRSLK